MAGLSYFSIQTYVYLGGDQLFTVPFPYIQKSDVAVYVNAVQVVAANVEWTTDSQVRIINQTLTPNDKVVVRRFTRKDRRWAEYYDGSVLTENDLNITTVQLLYLIQELYDYGIAGDSGDPPPGGVGGPGDPGDPGNQPIIDEVVNELLNSQLFQNLLELIEMVDINAESVMSNIVNTHTRWSEDRRYSGIVRALDQGLEDIDTRFTNEVNERITADEARITQITALQARMHDAEADIINVNTAIATNQYAMTERVGIAESRIGDAEALINGVRVDVEQALGRVGTVEQTYASREYAEAYVQQQLDARFVPTTLNGYLNATSVINGIRARADSQSASINSVSSYLVGSGATMNPDGSINWPAVPAGGIAHALAGMQTTVGGHTSQLEAELEFRQALAAKYTGGNLNAQAMVSALETAYRTYADSQSTTASSVQTLQSNRQPIFFRDVAPDPNAAEFAGTPFATNSFPEGTMWYQKVGNGGYKPYRWQIGGTVPALSPPLFTFGPYVTGTKSGRWIEYRNDYVLAVEAGIPTQINNAIGALAQTVSETYVREDEVGARVQTQLQAVYGANWAGINNRLESWINPETGLMYSGWDLRINQSGYDSSGNPVPVIAGVGLGMQQDINNPNAPARSQFIVMANNFGVVKPPSGTDLVAGTVDLNSIRVPFVIDTDTGTVGINGTLIVKGSLYAYDGVVGRMTITQLNTNGKPSEPNGMRLVMPSGLNNWNSMLAPSPFYLGSNPQRALVWAGTGDMTHNNAIFYVDTDGNALFKGRISAQNIEGAVSNAWPVDWEGAVAEASSGTGYGPFIEVPGAAVVVPAPVGVQGMKVLVFVTALFDENPAGSDNTSSGKFRITIEPYGSSSPAPAGTVTSPGGGGGSTWDDPSYGLIPKSISSQEIIAEAPFIVPKRGNTVTLTGVYNAAIRTSVRVRFWFCGYDSTVTTCRFIKGFVQGIR